MILRHGACIEIPDIIRALPIRGWMTSDELWWIAERAAGARIAVEVGCYAGRTSRAIADNLPAGGKLYCVDPLTDESLAEHAPGESGADVRAEFISNLGDRILEERVELVRETSETAASLLFELRGEVDFVFIDGAHDGDSVSDDIALWVSMLRHGGVIAGHDFDAAHPGVVGAVSNLLGDVKLPAGSIWSAVRW